MIERMIWIEFLLQNRATIDGYAHGPGEWHGRPPLFFVGPPLSNALGRNEPVIYLPFRSAAKLSSSLNSFVDRMIAMIQSTQNQGPYLLAGYCASGFITYEIARRLESIGEEVRLLALIECKPDETFWLRSARWLLMSVTNPVELLRRVRGRLDKLKARALGENETGEEPNPVFLLLNGLLQDYWNELDQGRASYSGPLVLLFGSRSHYANHPFMPHFWLTRRWSRVVRGKIEVVLVPGDHWDVLSSESLARALSTRIDTALRDWSPTDRVAERSLCHTGITN